MELEKMIKMLQKQIVFKSNQLNNMNKFIENLQPRNGLSSENPHVENIPVVEEKETTKAIENEIIFDIPKKSEPMYKI